MARGRRIIRLKQGFSAERCTGCRAVYASPLPSAEALDAYYADWLFSLPEPSVHQRWRAHTQAGARTILEEVAALRGAPVATMLDLGGGLGFYANGFAEHGVASSLFDLSSASRDHARTVFPALSVYDDMDAALDGGPYDLVVVNQVIEHLRDPVAFMRTARRALSPSGVLIVSTPNNAMSDFAFRKDVLRRYVRTSSEGLATTLWRLARDSWVPLDPPRHLFAFDAVSLGKTMARAGYEAARLTSYDHERDPLGYPAYAYERRDLRSRVHRLVRQVGRRTTALLDRKHLHRNTLVGFFRSAA